ncbi:MULTISPECIES: hypothetical protein [unclassified Microcystis]|jgi:hypothetical protein|uniref:hypothetical protein n=1 Tax=unclassified Microcystis TaxID=2643300 RepID=UPI00258C6AC3|nr:MULTISPECIES: hypothetical protein [unclassified Microcystis]MCA2764296.1 hypothetical protein [Microcystis sp. M151S2]MCA2642834.1 hypothetical protein [Microcystis sp. M087S2]MCA2672166.1 hypothetical protein [Microcystis sp. M080S2]MCA2687825.1 hypothetical protein [Microcystis sp. M037S2]MCA2735134.1 hypothetical protein [Microcystis sp. M158S2]
MNFNFSFCCFYVTVSFDCLFHWVPSKQGPLEDVIAFLNGGYRSGTDGYHFISEQGFLHFAFLTNQLDVIYQKGYYSPKVKSYVFDNGKFVNIDDLIPF